MAILNKGTTYASGDNVTAANINALVDSATFKTGSNEATDNSTLQVHSDGYLMVKDGGISSSKLAAGAVDATSIGSGAITSTQLATNSVTSSQIASSDVTESKIAANAISASKISDTDAQFLVDDTSTQKKVVINEGGTDVDFRVEGDTDTNLLVCDATNDAIGIGTAPGGTFKLNVNSTTANIANFETAATSSALFIRSTNTSATSAILQLVAQASGGSSYTQNLNIDLNSTSNTLQTAFGTGDQIGVALTNSNGGSGSETGAYYPTFDNKTTLGLSGRRWSVVYAGTAAINTSDRNLKEEIQDLSDAELRVAQACKGLVKRFKFKGGTRKHIGVIAQDVRDAFSAEGLDAHEYGLFCSDTWTDEDTGEEVTQLGIRYEELLAFIISAL
mgnify:CR=1 FL=1